MRVPLTILTGFLGSGKTTLINRILDASKTDKKVPRRIAIIENEFAAAFGVENEILHEDKSVNVQSLYEFGWGCVCCSSSGELINALVEIASENDLVTPDKRIEHIILETTGLADPAPILRLVQQGTDGKGTDEIVKNFYVDGIVTVVDSKHFIKQAEEDHGQFKNEPLAQISTSDFIVLNKTDLLTKEQLPELLQYIKKHNPKAQIVPTTFSQVPLDTLFHLRPENAPLGDPEWIDKTHDPAIDQTMLMVNAPVDKQRVTDFVREATERYNAYRVKGVLSFPGDDGKYVLQGVGSEIEITHRRNWGADEPRDSRIMFIGRHIKNHLDALQSGLNACVVSATTERNA